MGFEVKFYTFNKKRNSTARPSTAAKTYSDCIMRDGCGVLSPIIAINDGGAAFNPSAYNYAYISSFSRYYWVDEWKWGDGLWWANCSVDALATWKNSIGSTTAYVLRSAYSWNGNLVDRLYPASMKFTFKSLAAPVTWSCGPLWTYHEEYPNSFGMYVVAIASLNGIKYYVFDYNNLRDFLRYIFSDTYYDQVLGSLSISLYPEAKIALDPLQYILSVKFYPCDFGVSSWGIAMSDYQPTEYIQIGTVQIPHPTVGVPGSGAIFNGTIGSTHINRSIWSVQFDSTLRHPDADDRGDYLNSSPYTEYELYYPPFGYIQLDGSDMANADQLDMVLSIDARTGLGSIECFARYDPEGPDDKSLPIGKTEASCAVDIPLAHVQVPGVNPISMGAGLISTAANVVVNALSGNYIGAATALLGGASNAVQDAVEGKTPHMSKTGSVGSLASMYGAPMLVIRHYTMSGDDVNNCGRPLCRTAQISSIPGFIQCDPSSFSCAGTPAEIAEIADNMSRGFYYA